MAIAIHEREQSNALARLVWYVFVFAASYAGVYGMMAWLNLWWYAVVFNLFLGLLAITFILCEIRPLQVWLSGILRRFSLLLSRRGAFRSDAIVEAPKFALLRVLFGGFMAERCLWMIVYLQPSDWTRPEIWLLLMTYLVVVALITVGFLTQPALIFLVMVQWQIGDQILGVTTLGNDIAAMLAILLLFGNAGAHLSIDGWLMRRKGAAGRLIGRTYYPDGLPSDDTLQIVKFLTLVAYWLVCIYSLSMHINEPAWTNGTAGPLLLTNNFMSRFPDLFGAFFSLAPWAVLLGRISIWAMMLWYPAIVPFVLLGGYFRLYIIVWGTLFFLLSLFVLQLGWLAHFEFLLFAGWFWERRFIAGPKLQVAYDDRCNLCDRTINVIKRVDIFNRVELRPLSKNQQWLRDRGIDPADAATDLYGVEPLTGRHAKGYEFYLLLASRILLLAPLVPLLYVGRYLGGRAIYRFIADRRTRLFGVCQIPTPKPDHQLYVAGSEPDRRFRAHDPVFPFSIQFAAVALAYLLMIPAPFIGWDGVPLSQSARLWLSTGASAAHIYGIAPINVFNQTDLRMAENWFVIDGIDAKGGSTILPILAENGGRLGMHRSDRVYFGNTLYFRRAVIGSEGCQFEHYQAMLRYLVETWQVSLFYEHFIYRQYVQILPSSAELIAGVFHPGEIRQVCRIEF